MIRSLFFSVCSVLGLGLSAQQNTSQRTCGTDILPAQYETWIQSITPSVTPGKYGAANVQSVFNIPVIVHIIHNNESVNGPMATSGNNLNAAQVIDQINILNKDFNGLNADTSLIPAIFKPLIGKFQINFCLAVVNPTGGILAEPGIDRINLVAKGWSPLPYAQNYINSTVKPNSIWNPNLYLNMWVAPLSSGLLGYATFPAPGTSGLPGLTGSFGTATTDGVVILNSSFGSVGTAQFGQYNKGRTATHEVGHWLGLRHIWGDSNCGSDFCNDTPVAQSANYGCPGYPFNVGVCSGNTTGEMTMNFMDYTEDACMYMFSADQKYRAQLILTNSPIRAALITSTVCNLPTIGNDIGITFVSKPTYSQSISCLNYIDPVINVKNYGSTTLASAMFVYNVDGVNTQTLNWTGSVPPNTSFTVALSQITGLTIGAHIFNITVASPNGGSDNNLSNNNDQQHFTINSSLSLGANSGIICPGNSITLTATGATSYNWSTGATTATVSLNPSITTVYTVTGTAGLCNAQKTVTVTVQNPPVLTINKNSVCEGKATLITASGANSYTWSNGTNSAASNITLLSTTVFTVKGASSAGCVTTQTFNILVNPLPTSTVSPSYITCSSCMDGTMSVDVSGGTAPYIYNWMPGNMNTDVITDLPIGCYTVTITDVLGCTTENSRCVTFETGISRITNAHAHLKVTPNPTQGEFLVDFGIIIGEKKIEITDAIGRTIHSAETNSSSLSLDLSNYASGVYYLKILDETNFSVMKLIKN